jgi:hypothetical protein
MPPTWSTRMKNEKKSPALECGGWCNEQVQGWAEP